ncbi:MAG TPA: cell wall-binding repeat-containing protein [Solirubrobacterales bacterium]|nr:cell wall-binding repeat-containing protein [Solirubrobacterales bacterium]
MAGERPINADVPALEPPEAPPPAQAKRWRKPIPGALKAIAALVILAVAFIVAAVLGGSSNDSDDGSTGIEASASETASELGYPAFATSNTTRVGGEDPAANAAGVALAVYPSTEPGLRPAAVTLLDEENWQAAIAASVLMAEPIGAPTLVSSPDGLPEPSAEALSALDPQGGAATRGAAAFAIGDIDTGDAEKVTRIASRSPAAGAAAIARLREQLTGKAPAHIVVASSQDPGLAMPAAAWAARSGDPVLFAERDKLPKATATALRRHPDVPVYVLGPSSAISSDVVRAISEIANRVSRVSGEDPVANAIAFARYDDGDFGWNINDPGHGFVVARAHSPLDAAAAAPLSASGTWGPLLLTDSADTLPGALRGYLLDVKPGYTTDPTRAFYNHVWVIGDQEAIDVNQQAEINNLAELAKIGGAP